MINWGGLMKNIAAFFDIDGTLYRDSLMVEHFKKLIKYFSESNKIIVAICSAVINLLESGYIKNKKVKIKKFFLIIRLLKIIVLHHFYRYQFLLDFLFHHRKNVPFLVFHL